MIVPPSQVLATASQNDTLPLVKADVPAFTEAVSVTAVPALTDETTLSDDVIASVVEVAVWADRTATVIAVLPVMLPDVPVIVTVAFAAAASSAAVSVRRLEPPVAGLGEKLAVTPAGTPLAESVTSPLKPFWAVTVMVDFSDDPGGRLIVLGAAAKLKPGALMVSDNVVDAVKFPEVPVIVTVAVPGTAASLALSFKIALLVAGLGENDAVTPPGRPVAAKFTSPLKPFCPEIWTFDVPESPSFKLRLLG